MKNAEVAALRTERFEAWPVRFYSARHLTVPHSGCESRSSPPFPRSLPVDPAFGRYRPSVALNLNTRGASEAQNVIKVAIRG